MNSPLGLVPSSIVGAGAAYVFTEPGTGWANMTETAKLTPSDSAANNRFGGSVSIKRRHGGSGAYDATVGGHACQGAAYVYTMLASHWTSMTQTAKLTPLDGGACNYFGTSVSIDGDLVAVADGGGNGVTYLFTESGSVGAKPPSSSRPMADREVLSTAPCRWTAARCWSRQRKATTIGSGLPVFQRVQRRGPHADRPVGPRRDRPAAVRR